RGQVWARSWNSPHGSRTRPNLLRTTAIRTWRGGHARFEPPYGIRRDPPRGHGGCFAARTHCELTRHAQARRRPYSAPGELELGLVGVPRRVESSRPPRGPRATVDDRRAHLESALLGESVTGRVDHVVR